MLAPLTDTSCLIALTRIQKLGLLKTLFGSITITPEVAEEYEAKSDAAVQEWMDVAAAKNRSIQSQFEIQVDRGEASLIALAKERERPLLILDDRRARKLAEGLGLSVTGTIGVLIQASSVGLIPDLRATLSGLRATGFHFTNKLEAEALNQAGLDF